MKCTLPIEKFFPPPIKDNFRGSFKYDQNINFNEEIQILIISILILFISIIIFKKVYMVIF